MKKLSKQKNTVIKSYILFYNTFLVRFFLKVILNVYVRDKTCMKHAKDIQYFYYT